MTKQNIAAQTSTLALAHWLELAALRAVEQVALTMFSYHALHSLVAELVLVSLAAAILLYKCCGGRNEWLTTHGVILVSYYAVGGVVYDELEGWPLLDSIYFLTVSITTVGYGDISPSTVGGKWFVCVWALSGFFLFSYLLGLSVQNVSDDAEAHSAHRAAAKGE